MAQSADLRRTAEALIGIGSSQSSDSNSQKRLNALSERADRPTLVAIARLLLSHAPPAWLAIALDQTGVKREYIPSRDLERLSWLGAELDRLLRTPTSS